MERTPSNPIENLTRLSQFAGAYTTTMMDKVAEVSILVQEKYDKIMQLQQQLDEERSSLNQKVEQQLLKFKQDMEMLKISHENDLSRKNTLIKELREEITNYEGIPTAN